MATLSEPPHLGDLLKFELAPIVCRDTVTVLGGIGTARILALGTVLGRITLGTATAAAKAGGNTGTGTLTLDAETPVLAQAMAGVYAVRCIAAAANGGTFRVTDPLGRVLGDVAAGATFSNQIRFALADGATDFAAGDGFDVTVAAGSGKVVALDPAAVDGSAQPCGVLLAAVTAPAGTDMPGIALTRGPAAIAEAGLVYPDGADAGQKAAIAAALAALGIPARPAA